MCFLPLILSQYILKGETFSQSVSLLVFYIIIISTVFIPIRMIEGDQTFLEWSQSISCNSKKKFKDTPTQENNIFFGLLLTRIFSDQFVRVPTIFANCSVCKVFRNTPLPLLAFQLVDWHDVSGHYFHHSFPPPLFPSFQMHKHLY